MGRAVNPAAGSAWSEKDITTELVLVRTLGPRREPASEKAASVVPQGLGSPDRCCWTATKTEASVNIPTRISQHGERQRFAFLVLINSGARLESNNIDPNAYALQFVCVLAQLREMVSAGQSAKPTEKHQQDGSGSSDIR